MISIFYLCCLYFVCAAEQTRVNDKIRIVIRSEGIFLDDIKQSLEGFDFQFDSRINDNLFIFVKETKIPNHRLLSSELEKLQRSNRHIEKLAQSYRLYPESPFKPRSAANGSDVHRTEQWNVPNILGSPYFDQALGIDDLWLIHNVTGRGIVVGVVDVGINANNTFIRENINFDLSYNFVDNIQQTRPTILPDIKESSPRTGHANACAGLIARPKTDDKYVPCGIGVAHGAKVADLQIAKREERIWTTQVIDSAIFSRALAFRRDAIPIFSNSWATPRALWKSEFYEEEVLTEGIKEGRDGLGTVYVFPAGNPGSGFANEIGSITVACLGVNGTVAGVSAVNAATLVAVFCNGRKRNDKAMITVGQDEKMCDTNFGGESAATAIVSGMIALLLEANPGLSARDVKHILIESSSHLRIEATPEFMRNSALKFYHPNVGFGLPDCSKMVLLGRHWKQLKPLCTRTLTLLKNENEKNHNKGLDWYVQGRYDKTYCDTAACIEKMEEVMFDIEFVYSEMHDMKLWAKSPRRTESTLVEMKAFANGDKPSRVRTTFRSNHFWGENSEGRWHVYIGCNLPMTYPNSADVCQVVNARITIHGTLETGRKPQHCNMDTDHNRDIFDIKKTYSNTADWKPVGNNIKITNNLNTNNVNIHNENSNSGVLFLVVLVLVTLIIVVAVAVYSSIFLTPRQVNNV